MVLFERKPKRGREVVAAAIAVGAGLAVAGGLLAWLFYRRRGEASGALETVLAQSEEDVVERLRADERLAGQPIEVAALANGIIELSGAVETERDADLAVTLARRVAGIRTVLNRLDIREEMARVEDARHREVGPGTARNESRWLGMGVGMGRRRQSRQTNSARHDDRADIVAGELGIDRAVDNASEPLDKIPNATEGHATASQSAPDEYGTVRDTPDHRAGHAQRSPQDLPTPTSENVGPGTEATLEQSGLEGELRHREGEEES